MSRKQLALFEPTLVVGNDSNLLIVFYIDSVLCSDNAR